MGHPATKEDFKIEGLTEGMKILNNLHIGDSGGKHCTYLE